MAHKDPHKYLNDMRDRAAFAVELLADRARQDLNSDRVLRSALERELSIVGEALYQLHQIAPAIATKIENWQEIIRFRHVLVHGYSTLDMDVIWDVVRDDLNPLILQIEIMLKE